MTAITPKGLEIVALDFEKADQQASLTRVHAFIKQYKIPYTYLIAGTPDEMWDKVPQAVNLNTWPQHFLSDVMVESREFTPDSLAQRAASTTRN